MKTDYLHEDSATDPLADYAGDALALEDAFHRKMAASNFDEISPFLETIIADMPEGLLGHVSLQQLLTRTGNSAFRFEAIRVKPVKMISDTTEIHVTFDFVAEGHLGSDHDQKRTISGEATAIFRSPEGVVFQVNNAEVNPDGDGAVVVPGSESPKRK